jgi:hypothetical protein
LLKDYLNKMENESDEEKREKLLSFLEREWSISEETQKIRNSIIIRILKQSIEVLGLTKPEEK